MLGGCRGPSLPRSRLLELVDEREARAPLRPSGGVGEEVHDEHVVELEPLCLRHRHDERAGQAERRREAVDALLAADEHHLVRSELHLRRRAVRAGDEDGQVLLVEAVQEERGRAVEEGALAGERVERQREHLAEERHADVGAVEDARVRAVVERERVHRRRVDGRQRQRLRTPPLALRVEEGPNVLEPESGEIAQLTELPRGVQMGRREAEEAHLNATPRAIVCAVSPQ